MAKSLRGLDWHLAGASLLAIGYAIATSGNCTLAQIAPDSTLGRENSTVKSIGSVDQINGGATRGANLFHSFDQFSVLTGREAYFNNDSNIQNIFSRVTGESISNIDGLIRANASANLFLLNPNGIIFGPNASLNIGGSFLASTASSLNFTHGTQFSATAPQATPLLTVSVPIGLQYGGTAQSILNQSQAVNSNGELVGLQVLPSKTLALVGGDVGLDGGILQAQGGRVELGGLAGAGTIGLNGDGSLSFPEVVARANVSIANRAKIDATSSDTVIPTVGKSGDINITAGSLSLTDSDLSSYNFGGGDAGNISLQSDSSISIENSEFSSATNYGDAGNISLQSNGSISIKNSILDSQTEGNRDNTGSISLQSNDSISIENSGFWSVTFGEGDGGSISLQSNGSISLKDSTISSQTAGNGNGGDIYIQAQSLSLTDGSRLFATTQDEGNAGNIRVNTSDFVNISGIDELGELSGMSTAALLEDSGQGGEIIVTTGVLRMRDEAFLSASTTSRSSGGSITVTANNFEDVSGAQLLTSTSGNGRAGDITLKITDSMTLSGANSGLFANTDANSTGNGGTIKLNTTNLTISDRAGIAINSSGRGSAGSLLSVNARNAVTLDNAFISSQLGTEAVGQGGAIGLQAESLSLTNGAQLQASTAGHGNAGNVNIDVRDNITLTGVNNNRLTSGVFSTVEKTATGIDGNLLQGGDIDIQVRSLSLSDGAQLQASTAGQGNAGKISVNTDNDVSVSGTNSGLFTNTNSAGKGGDITVDTNAFHLSDNAILNAETSNVGDGGNIQVNANTLELSNGAALSSSTSGVGDAGSIFVQADDSVSLINNSQIRSAVESQAVGNGNQINIQARTLSLSDGAQLRADTSGVGDAGNININTTESISVSGTNSISGFSSGLLTSTNSTGRGGSIRVGTSTFRVGDGAVVDARTTAQTQGAGAAGDLSITTGQLLVQSGAQVSASTEGAGLGGTLEVSAPTGLVELIGAGSHLTTETQGTEAAGNLTITTLALQVLDGARISASTSGSGQGGTLSVTAPESVTLSGMGSLSAQATADGNAGDLTINTLAFTVADGAEATVSSQQGQAGNLRVTANSIFLDRGSLSAVTAKSQPGTEGANITLQVPDLLLMGNESRISADALETANGGNINIDANFLIALPPTGPSGSDIRANAFQGNGGKLNIAASGIFGIEFRPRETALNDITARSEFGDAGEAWVNTPDVDPSLGLVANPAELVDASGLIAQTCPAGGGQGQSEFIVTGRGGLPDNPSDTLSSDAVEVDLVTLNPKVENRSSPTVSTNSTSPAFTQIVEAQGWVINNKGEVVLTASAPTVTPQNPWITQATCYGSEMNDTKITRERFGWGSQGLAILPKPPDR